MNGMSLEEMIDCVKYELCELLAAKTPLDDYVVNKCQQLEYLIELKVRREIER